MTVPWLINVEMENKIPIKTNIFLEYLNFKSSKYDMDKNNKE
tara:strand:+ start:366 stop:491 length:126 start_codon:yes stop_codon:yes gene_type:complete